MLARIRLILGFAAALHLAACDCSESVPFKLTPDSVARGTATEVVIEFQEPILDESDPTGVRQGLRIVMVETNGSRNLDYFADPNTPDDDGITDVVVMDSRRIRFELLLPDEWRAGNHSVAVNIGYTPDCNNKGSVGRISAE